MVEFVNEIILDTYARAMRHVRAAQVGEYLTNCLSVRGVRLIELFSYGNFRIGSLQVIYVYIQLCVSLFFGIVK